MLDWLVSGQLLDHGRLPVVTVFAALGFALAWLAWSSAADARALLAALAVCLLFAFGRTTLGSLVEVIPGGADLFFRRFMMGVQLAALLLAGRGAAWLAARCVPLLEARVPRWPPGLSPAAAGVAAVAVLAPAWLQLGAYDRHDGAAITAQRRADVTYGADVDRLVAVIERDGGGRTYAGMPSNYSGPYWLWTIDGGGYVQAGRIIGEISANRTNVGARSRRVLGSELAANGAYLSVRYGSGGGGDSRLPTVRSQSSADAVRAERAGLHDGEALVTVRMRRPGIAVLSASYDPGWTATVNGRRRPIRMVAPALVAVDVPAGTNHVVLRFHGYGDYPALLALSGLTLAMVAVAPMCTATRRRCSA